MAELLEIEENATDDKDVQDLPTQPEETQQAVQPEEQTQEQVDDVDNSDDIPEKYRGKSMKELVEMHQNAEKAIGKQGGEVGELRKLVDEYIQAQTPSQPEQTQSKPTEEIDFYTNPEKAVEQAIENNPAVREAKEAAQTYKVEAARSQLLAKHPDVKETLADPKFAEWVQKSPYRKKQFINAEVHYDMEAVDELLSGWKEHRSFVNDSVQTQVNDRKESVKNASTGSTQSSQGGNRKPVYRRADIIKLINDDPARYEALYPDIEQAYREGRVK